MNQGIRYKEKKRKIYIRAGKTSYLYKRITIRLMSNISPEILNARRQKMINFHVWRRGCVQIIKNPGKSPVKIADILKYVDSDNIPFNLYFLNIN